MRNIGLIGVSFLLLAGGALAAGTHSGGHGHDDAKTQAGSHGHDMGADHHEMAVGVPGTAEKVNRTINVVMRETDDGSMIFEPSSLEVKRGETIRFSVVNKGELEHEFVLDDHGGVQEHMALMMKFPEMEHDDPNAVRLQPGASGEILWTFTNAGEFEFACLIPGHYQAGMKGPLNVVESMAGN